MKALTEKQAAVVAFIRERISNGLPPTVRELQAFAKVGSPNAIQEMLNRLETKGAIIRERGKARAISLPESVEVRVPRIIEVDVPVTPESPQWRRNPTGPGIWICDPQPGTPGFGSMNVLNLTAADIARGAPFRTSRVYGPIPKD